MNEQLSNDYWTLVTAYAKGPAGLWSYKKQRFFIEKLDIDLEKYFRENNGFDKLDIKGLGKDTKRKLELILNLGIKEAVKAIIEGRIRELEEHSQFSFRSPFPRGRGTQDQDPGFDDAERIIEK
jgi:hypothetical protein